MGSSSRERTDWLGNKYIEHTDSSGKKTGESRERTDWLGNTYIEHTDSSGKKTGESRDRTDWFGGQYTTNSNSSGKKTGESRDRTDWFGGQYTEHTDPSGKKTGESRERTDWFGGQYTEHSGSGWLGSVKSSSSTASKSTSTSNTSDGDRDTRDSMGGSSDGSGGGLQGSSASGSSYGASSSTSGLGLVVGVLIFVVIFISGLFTSMQGPGSKDRPMQSDTHVNNPQREAPIVPAPSAQEEAPNQEAMQPLSEKVEQPARTVRDFRVPMNPSIAAANEFKAEVRLPDGSIEPTTIAGLNKSSDILYVTLTQDYPEGTVLTIYPKIEYSNRFVVPGNPGILTSPSVSVIVQLPDGRSFQPSVQNIEREMTQLIVTTRDSYPTGTKVIVTPVYGGY
jgi:hypothetical protein